ncbi:MAG: DNA polymerase III subunit delta [Pseudomonadota bacterium]
MQLRFEQFAKHLDGPLAPIYLLSGDEPLQIGEAFDALLAAARHAEFTDRTQLDVETGFDWAELGAERDSFSLFAEKRVIDLRLGTSKLGDKGARALVAYIEAIPEDTLLVITASQIDARTRRSAWFQALDAVGVSLQVWPIDANRLGEWLERRLKARGLRANRDAIAELAARGEGNLLACAQEIERLSLLVDSEVIELQDVVNSTNDNARFETFDLVDATLAGNGARAIRILRGLAREGIAPNLVIGTLAWQLRTLAGLSHAIADGTSLDQAIRRQPAWSRRRNAIGQALRRSPRTTWVALLHQLSLADAAAKGAGPGDPWVLLEEIALAACGLSAVPSNPL